VADGIRELTEGDLLALHVPPDKGLSITDTHLKNYVTLLSSQLLFQART
jgi:hypothetical protein